MSEKTTPETPKVSFVAKYKKKLFIAIAIVLVALGIDHYTFHYVSGGVTIDVTVTDSTIVVSPTIDTIIITKKDTAKKDSINKYKL